MAKLKDLKDLVQKVNSYHSKMTDFFDRYKEVGSKYLDHYLALFRWQEKGFNSKTAGYLICLQKVYPKKWNSKN